MRQATKEHVQKWIQQRNHDLKKAKQQITEVIALLEKYGMPDQTVVHKAAGALSFPRLLCSDTENAKGRAFQVCRASSSFEWKGVTCPNCLARKGSLGDIPV